MKLEDLLQFESEIKIKNSRIKSYSREMQEKLQKLMESDDPEAIRTLLDNLDNRNEQYTDDVKKNLKKKVTGEHADILIEYLNSPKKKHWQGIYYAIRLLGNIDSKKSIPTIQKFLHHKSSNVRIAVVQELGGLRSPEVVPSLLEALDDKNEYVVKHACIWLPLNADPSVAGHLEEKLTETKKLRDMDRIFISFALFAFGDVKKFHDILDYLTIRKKRNANQLRLEAADALSYVADFVDEEIRLLILEKLEEALEEETDDETMEQMEQSAEHVTNLLLEAEGEGEGEEEEEPEAGIIFMNAEEIAKDLNLDEDMDEETEERMIEEYIEKLYSGEIEESEESKEARSYYIKELEKAIDLETDEEALEVLKKQLKAVKR